MTFPIFDLPLFLGIKSLTDDIDHRRKGTIFDLSHTSYLGFLLFFKLVLLAIFHQMLLYSC